MFCIKCGLQIPDDVVFCPRCGTQVYQIYDGLSIQKNENKELDRSALIIYLKDILTLECIKGEYSIRLQNVRSKINNIRNNNYYKRYPCIDEWKYFHFYYDGKTYYVAHVEHGIYGLYLNSYLNLDTRYTTYYWKCVEPNYKELTRLSEYHHVGEAYGYFELLRTLARKADARDKFELYFQSFKTEAPKAYNENLNTINQLSIEENEVKKELDEAKRLLDKAYSVNIIPDNFRYNIYAVYFLYKFLDTSKESFTTALLQCKLDEITKQLETIIEQQREIIIQQAILASQNTEILKQNQAQLNALASVESNLEKASQYSSIAENNDDISTWIEAAKFLCKLYSGKL